MLGVDGWAKKWTWKEKRRGTGSTVSSRTGDVCQQVIFILYFLALKKHQSKLNTFVKYQNFLLHESIKNIHFTP